MLGCTLLQLLYTTYLLAPMEKKLSKSYEQKNYEKMVKFGLGWLHIFEAGAFIYCLKTHFLDLFDSTKDRHEHFLARCELVHHTALIPSCFFIAYTLFKSAHYTKDAPAKPPKKSTEVSESSRQANKEQAK